MDNMTAKVSCFAGAYHCKHNRTWVFRDEAALTSCGFAVWEHLDSTAMTRTFFSSCNNATPNHSLSAPQNVHDILAVKRHG